MLSEAEKALLRAVTYFGPHWRGHGTGNPCPEIALAESRGVVVPHGVKADPNPGPEILTAIDDVAGICGLSAADWLALDPMGKQSRLEASLG